LGVAHPTVWQQVRALERDLAAKLVEPHGRGCRLTEEGRLLAEMARPLVAGIDSIKRSFQEARAQVQPRLTVAVSQRTLIDDLPEPIAKFSRCYPHVQLCFQEVVRDEVIARVESRQADLGITVEELSLKANPRLSFEPAYELDLLLV